jgi:hypothetical protein
MWDHRPWENKLSLHSKLHELVEHQGWTIARGRNERHRILGTLRNPTICVSRTMRCHHADTHIAASTGTMSNIDSAPATVGPEGGVCTVCLEELRPQLFPSRRITATCDHPPDVCMDCLRESLTSQSQHKVWNLMDCPGCNRRLSHQDMQAWASKDTFGR